MKTRTAFLILAVALAAVPTFAGKTGIISTPTLSCGPGSTPASMNVTITAGATGLPAGFSVQWMLQSEYIANGGWPSESTVDLNVSSFCKASFSGNASGFNYSVKPYMSKTVTVGDIIFDTPGASSPCENIPLACNTTYVFRAFGHATSTLTRSDWSNTTSCTTLPCTGDPGCTYTQGYWKTHGPIPTGNNSNVWPVMGLTLGTVAYTDLEMLAIFNQPAQGNGLISLAHQLMAAKLNIANGADGSAVASAIAAADALIGSLVVPPIGTGSLPSSQTSALTSTLDNYNQGLAGPGHCP